MRNAALWGGIADSAVFMGGFFLKNVLARTVPFVVKREFGQYIIINKVKILLQQIIK